MDQLWPSLRLDLAQTPGLINKILFWHTTVPLCLYIVYHCFTL